MFTSDTFESAKERFQVEWVISNLRWLLLVGVTLVSLTDIFITHGSGNLDPAYLLPQIVLLIIATLYNVGMTLLLSYSTLNRSVTTLTLLADTVLAIGFVVTSGGLTGPLLFFALFPIMTAALRFHWLISLLVAFVIVVSCGFVGYVIAPPGVQWLDMLPFAARALVLLMATLVSSLVGDRVKKTILHLSLSGTAAGYERDLQDARANGDRLREGALLSQLGMTYADVGKLSLSIEHYEQSLGIARELDDHQAEAVRLQNLGLVLLRLADAEPDQSEIYLSRAADALGQAITLLDALAVAPLLRARTRYHLGRCYHQLGRWRETITVLEQARETFSRHKARPELAHTLLELGQLYHLTRDFESAYIYLKDALRLFRRLDDIDGITVTQDALGNLALQTARLPEAIAFLQEARQGYTTLQRSERVCAMDNLLQIAQQARQPAGREGAAL